MNLISGPTLMLERGVCIYGTLYGVWARDAEASGTAMLLFLGGVAVYIASFLLARTLLKSDE